MLLNLLGNAIKFTEAGEVALRVSLDGELAAPIALRFMVSDTGIGISDDKLSRVFERFTQADSSTTRRFGGSGLGLTISRSLVDLMGGRIWVESMIGKGSIFSFVLPFDHWPEASRRIAEPVDARPVTPLTPLRILLVEDYRRQSHDHARISRRHALSALILPKTGPSRSTNSSPEILIWF